MGKLVTNKTQIRPTKALAKAKPSSLLDIAIKKYGKKKTMEMLKQSAESSMKIDRD